eukprot:s4195_g5.t1
MAKDDRSSAIYRRRYVAPSISDDSACSCVAGSTSCFRRLCHEVTVLVTWCAALLLFLREIQCFQEPSSGVKLPFDAATTKQVTLRRALGQAFPIEVATAVAEAQGDYKEVLKSMAAKARASAVLPKYLAPKDTDKDPNKKRKDAVFLCWSWPCDCWRCPFRDAQVDRKPGVSMALAGLWHPSSNDAGERVGFPRKPVRQDEGIFGGAADVYIVSRQTERFCRSLDSDRQHCATWAHSIFLAPSSFWNEGGLRYDLGGQRFTVSAGTHAVFLGKGHVACVMCRAIRSRSPAWASSERQEVSLPTLRFCASFKKLHPVGVARLVSTASVMCM